MKKKHSKLFYILISIGGVFLALIVFLLVMVGIGDTYKASAINDTYDHVIKDAEFDDDVLVKDIALLGAHDAFSNHIKKSNTSNVNESNLANNGAVKALAGGLVTRMSKAQSGNAKEMLYAGVRYLDVRITKIENEYYTTHGFLSDTLKYYLQDVVDFMPSHNEEFLILDIQHFYTSNGSNYDLDDQEYVDLFNYIDTIKNEEDKSLLDYVYYDSSEPIGNLTYKDVKGGVIFLAKNKNSEYAFPRDGDGSLDEGEYTSIFSNWINTNDEDTLLKGMEETYNYLVNHHLNTLRVNQSQLTGFKADLSLIKSLFKWSLLDMADSSNARVIQDETTFKKYLSEMPIYMVDNATTSHGDFNTLANRYILEFNKTLKNNDATIKVHMPMRLH